MILSRKKNESIIVNDDIIITLIDVRGDKARIGITAPKEVRVDRSEVREAIELEKRLTSEPVPECGHCEARTWGQNGCGSWYCRSCGLAYSERDRDARSATADSRFVIVRTETLAGGTIRRHLANGWWIDENEPRLSHLDSHRFKAWMPVANGDSLPMAFAPTLHEVIAELPNRAGALKALPRTTKDRDAGRPSEGGGAKP